MITKSQGETIIHEVEVNNLDGTAADLSTCQAKVGLTKDGVTTNPAATITGNVVSIKLLPSVTETMDGKYIIEIKIKDASNDVEVISNEILYVGKSSIPSFE